MSTGNSGSSDHENSLLTYNQRNILVIVLLVILIVVLLITLVYLLMPPFLDWWRRRRAPKDDGDRKERRYQTIEGWLITKRVQPHTAGCDKIKKMMNRSSNDPSDGPSSPVKASSSFDSSDTAHTAESDVEACSDEKECPICMEPFKVDDVVSWSPDLDGTCKHVFHHECIKEWMLQSGNCPCCRELILPIDEEGYPLDRPVLKELCRKRAKLAATSYYCIVDGLVCFEAPSKCSREMFTILKAATACRVEPHDVSGRRGNRMNLESVTCDDMGEGDTEIEDLEVMEPSSDSNNEYNDAEEPSESSLDDDSTTGSARPLILPERQSSCGTGPMPCSATGNDDSRPMDEISV